MSTFDNPDAVKLGHCDLIEEIMIGEDRMVHFHGCALNEACTIVLRGASTRDNAHVVFGSVLVCLSICLFVCYSSNRTSWFTWLSWHDLVTTLG